VLKGTTPSSIVILDELGRGTSTFDGYAIAYSVLDYLATNVGCLTLFSTHYHLLCKEVEHNPLVALNHMSCYVDEQQGTVTFLYKLAEGACPKSYGMNVARTAGVIDSVVLRADRIAAKFEADPHFSGLSTIMVDEDDETLPVPEEEEVTPKVTLAADDVQNFRSIMATDLRAGPTQFAQFGSMIMLWGTLAKNHS